MPTLQTYFLEQSVSGERIYDVWQVISNRAGCTLLYECDLWAWNACSILVDQRIS